MGGAALLECTQKNGSAKVCQAPGEEKGWQSGR